MMDLQTPFAALHPVALDAVERELDRMWREANAHIAATAGHAISRNSVLTLVVMTQGRTEAQLLLEAIHTLSSQHPSRAILVIADPTQSGDGIQAHIGTYVGDDSTSYGEDIVIEAQTEAVRHLSGVVLPLIVSGLPSVLWWTGEPPWGSELLESLIDGSDRFIVDTSEMRGIEKSLGALDDVMRRKMARCAVSDTSWTSQAPWRDMVAQFFDSADLRPYLSGIERVTIEYAAGVEYTPTNAGQAYLFAGWLASRLGWRINQAQPTGVDESRQHTLYDSNNKVVMLEVTARYNVPQRHWWSKDGGRAASTPPPPAAADGHAHDTEPAGSGALPAMPWVRFGALMSVHLAARSDGQRGTFVVAREHDLAHATTLCQAPNCNVPSQTLHLQSIGERELLAGQLRSLGHDSVYEEALGAAAQLMGRGSRRRAQ